MIEVTYLPTLHEDHSLQTEVGKQVNVPKALKKYLKQINLAQWAERPIIIYVKKSKQPFTMIKMPD